MDIVEACELHSSVGAETASILTTYKTTSRSLAPESVWPEEFSIEQ